MNSCRHTLWFDRTILCLLAIISGFVMGTLMSAAGVPWWVYLAMSPVFLIVGIFIGIGGLWMLGRWRNRPARLDGTHERID